jgi:hypothetical protein
MYEFSRAPQTCGGLLLVQGGIYVAWVTGHMSSGLGSSIGALCNYQWVPLFHVAAVGWSLEGLLRSFLSACTPFSAPILC